MNKDCACKQDLGLLVTLSGNELMYAWLAMQAVPSQAEEAKSNAALNPDEWRSFKVMKKWPVTHNTEGFRYMPACDSIRAAAPGLHRASLMLILRCKDIFKARTS